MIQCTKNNLYFNKGDMLTSNMLKLMYSTPNQLLNATLLDYPNGVVSGFKLYLDGNKIVLSSGLVKTSYGLYYMSSDANLTQELLSLKAPVDTLYYLVLKSGKPRKLEQSIEQETLSLKFIPRSSNPLPSDVIEIGTLYYDGTHGTANTKEPKTLQEISRNFKSCLNLWNCQYSIVAGVALHPMVAQLVYKEISNKRTNDFLDFSMMSAINTQATVTRENIRCFCKQKLNVTLSEDWDNPINIDTLIRAIKENINAPTVKSKERNANSNDTVFSPKLDMFV